MGTWTVLQRISWLSAMGWLLFMLLSPLVIFLYISLQPWATQLYDLRVEMVFFGFHYIYLILLCVPLAIALFLCWRALRGCGSPHTVRLFLPLMVLFYLYAGLINGGPYNVSSLLVSVVNCSFGALLLAAIANLPHEERQLQALPDPNRRYRLEG